MGDVLKRMQNPNSTDWTHFVMCVCSRTVGSTEEAVSLLLPIVSTRPLTEQTDTNSKQCQELCICFLAEGQGAAETITTAAKDFL